METSARAGSSAIVQSDAARGSVAREIVCIFLAAAACEVVYLLSAAIGFWVKGLTLDYERWGGQIILSVVVIPQAFVVGYVLWMIARAHFVRRALHRNLRMSLGVGTALGLVYYLLADNVKWVVPWMLFFTR